jgi:hypothetical protein
MGVRFALQKKIPRLKKLLEIGDLFLTNFFFRITLGIIAHVADAAADAVANAAQDERGV